MLREAVDLNLETVRDLEYSTKHLLHNNLRCFSDRFYTPFRLYNSFLTIHYPCPSTLTT